MKSVRPKDGLGKPPTSGRNGESTFGANHAAMRWRLDHGRRRAALQESSRPGCQALSHRARPDGSSRTVANSRVSRRATSTAEREAAFAMIGDLPDDGRITLGTDKGYDTQDFGPEMRSLGVIPHVTQNTQGRRSAIDGRTTRHASCAASLRIRKRIDNVFGRTFTFVVKSGTKYLSQANKASSDAQFLPFARRKRELTHC
jgi:hypothetical protein